MANPQFKGRLFIVLIFAMAFIPFSIAWFFQGTAPFISGRTNKGKLIAPVVPTSQSDFIGLDAFSAANLAELKGHWVILNLVPQTDCNQTCQVAIHKTRQLRLMLNKDLTRTRRAVLFLGGTSPETAGQWLADDKVLLKLKPSAGLSKKMNELRQGNLPDGLLLLMDPLGNLMMQYEPGFDPYQVKSDLMHLLRISQIG